MLLNNNSTFIKENSDFASSILVERENMAEDVMYLQ